MRMISWSFGIGILAACLVVTGCGCNPIVLPVAVPNVVSMTEGAAGTTIVGAGLVVGTVTKQCSNRAVGTVISQTPPAGTLVALSSAVNLVISSGPCENPVPNVVGETSGTAGTTLTGAGFTTGVVTHQCSDTVAEGLVISQDPAAGTLAAPGTAVDLVISTGPCTVPVPNVVGQLLTGAGTTLTGGGLTTGTVTYQCDDTIKAGVVISETPPAGTQVVSGSPVNLVVSTGLCPTVPNVVGETQTAAGTTITGVTFIVGTVTQQCSDTVAVGLAISQSPLSGMHAAPGSAVDFVLSTGPCPVTVPNVVGLTQTAAGTTITGSNLTVGTVTQQCSNTVAAGLVISESPPAGAQVTPGSAVALVVSTGTCLVAVPNVVGQTQTAAGTTLGSTGLGTGTVTQQCSNTVAAGLVISETPPAGTLVAPGTPGTPGALVALVVSTGPCDVTVPGVEGQTQINADMMLTTAGLVTGTITQQCSDTFLAGRVISQAPAVGTQTPFGSAVALVISTGPCDVTVPDVAGQTQNDAGSILTGAGLTTGTVTQQCSNTVAAGLVVSQAPSAGDQAPFGSAVDLVISTGPCTATVPDVVGETEPGAGTVLTGAGLTAGNTTEECSDTVAVGLVISQTPLAAAQAPFGSAVDFVISTGPCNAVITLPGDVSLETVWVPGGLFAMGSPDAEPGSNSYEKPQHPVTLGGFWMGKYEVTKRQWQAVMGVVPSPPWTGQSSVLADLDSPAVFVSWAGAQSFVSALNSYTGQTFRLPTEAEWEYACRAGTLTRFYWGDDLSSVLIDGFAWWNGNAFSAGQRYAHVVGGKTANSFGLFDMNGNAWEWAQDWYHDGYTGAPSDGSAWESPAGTTRVIRSGSWSYYAGNCRSATRFGMDPSFADAGMGFRIAK